jgi:hypothetical protein
MDRYFKVPMAAATAIAEASCDVDLMAGYAVLCRFATPKEYTRTAAGAKAIRKALGLSDYMSKQVLTDLLALRFGGRGERFLIEPTGFMVKNAREYAFGRWDGMVSYLPDLLVQGAPAPLARIAGAHAAPEVRRDALLLFFHVCANVDYARWFGVDPESFVYCRWSREGTGSADGIDLDLGHYGEVDGLDFWLMRDAGDGLQLGKRNVAAVLFGGDDAGVKRFQAAFTLLLEQGMLCRVAIVEAGGSTYPLWVFSDAYREGLRRCGITADLGHSTYNAADRAGLDPNHLIVTAAFSSGREAKGTGLFFVVTKRGELPTVRTVFAPTVHAPSPMNLEGLREVDIRTREWLALLERVQWSREVA